MADTNKYYVKCKHPLPKEKLTSINWEAVIDLISKNGIRIVRQVRYWNSSGKGRTRQIEGAKMLKLWKAVQRTNRN